MLDRIKEFFKQSSGNQEENEALVTLATFFYKVDGRVTLEEQDYIDDLLSVMEWNSSIDIQVFQSRIIPKINDVLVSDSDADNLKFLSNLMASFTTDEARSRAKQIARAISDADGEIDDREVKCLEYIKQF